ncbi:chromosome segregation protein SMC [Ureaplasma miroungigenitalium]|uniref:Chromosome segregation protein SMC n=1 Tax=Ureaplasma miroungigenitalium TaxID=1042321 RepID=A0ABT3BMU9_9BACT|nr:chromosome segregation SMC family protein [Ureaplasma miroungigenitalium]MCV3728554.1 chromosome segregation protein SMC [Ureaplasma miroungigenitalium]
MIFLKRFEAQGFKSFAKYTQTILDHPITGIIGPNGSGKSNIIDALKWVLGEHSKSAIRADKHSLAFLGNDLVQKANFIRVSLYFNNVNQILYTDLNEVKITKFYDLKKDDVIYYINDEVVKFKDIQDMFLDSGLLKGSLGIISQGKVSWFADAKPIERRKMFDEAAGIGKYFKRKKEAEANLVKSQTDLDRLNDNLYSMKKDLNTYNKQKEEFLRYTAVQKELEKIELNLYAKSLDHNYKYKKELTDKMRSIDESISILKPEIDTLHEKQNKNSQRFQALQEQLVLEENAKNKLYDQLMDVNRRLTEHKAFLKAQGSNDQVAPQERYDNLLTLKNENEKETLQYEKLVADKEVEIEKNRQQLKEQKQAMASLFEITNNLSTQKKQLQYQINDLRETINRELARERGTNAIINAKDFIPGVHSTVLQAIQTDPEHELAINTALSKNVYNIIVQNNQVAQTCVEYLQKNKAGQAVFLPLENLKAKSIRPEFYDAVQTLKGFVGVANELVKIKPSYQMAVDYLLGNILIAQNLSDALVISETTYKNYKVITLDGQVVFAGGAIMGGDVTYNKKTSLNLDEKINGLEKEFEAIILELNEKQAMLKENQYQVSLFDSRTNELYDDLSKLKGHAQSLNYDHKNLILELEKLANVHTTIEAREKQISVISEEYEAINQSFLTKMGVVRNLQTEIDSLGKFIQQEVQSREGKYQNFNNLLTQQNKYQAEIATIAQLILKYETIIIEDYQYTVEKVFEEYLHMPFEYTDKQALELISQLKIQKSQFKSINFNVLNEYETKLKEYEALEQEVNTCLQAVDVIKTSIKTLDQQAKNDFKKVLKEVNAMIPQIFEYFFAQGTCQILLEDDQNVLESGIEIIANPMNKKNVALHQLSGGEKTLVVLVILFALLKVAKFPLVILDEAEAALDEINVDKFAHMIQRFGGDTQFLIITHRQGTMRNCGVLIGTTMHKDNVSMLTKINLDNEMYVFEEKDN